MISSSALQRIIDGFDKAAVDWKPFRRGVQRADVKLSAKKTCSAAFLRYEPGAAIPLHEHTGYELIYVLSGSQCDQRGHYPAGRLILNEPGSRHSVTSEGGCVVFAVWEKPVKFIR